MFNINIFFFLALVPAFTRVCLPTQPTALCTVLSVLSGKTIGFHVLHHDIQPALHWASERSHSRDWHNKALASDIVLRPARNVTKPSGDALGAYPLRHGLQDYLE